MHNFREKEVSPKIKKKHWNHRRKVDIIREAELEYEQQHALDEPPIEDEPRDRFLENEN